MSKPDFLDCSLRDGSYTVDYQFTERDTHLIVGGLASSGISLIEVGHGMGLGASREGYGLAACTDEQYIRAAKSASGSARIGVFAIPGIATPKDVLTACDLGLDFLRVGTDVTNVPEARALLEAGIHAGVEVSLNLMKSYAVHTSKLEKVGAFASSLGVRTVSVVDSAGTMLPTQVRDYVQALASQGISVGFHGHNNLQMAVANTLEAFNAGATVLDGTLRGIGRSSGNAQLEILIQVLAREGVPCGIDSRALGRFSDWYFQSELFQMGNDALEVACGITGFHSSFLPRLINAAQTHGCDVIELMELVTTNSRVTLTAEQLEGGVLGLTRRSPRRPAVPALQRVTNRSSATHPVTSALAECLSMARKQAKIASLTIAAHPSIHGSAPLNPADLKVRFPRVVADHVIAHIECSALSQVFDNSASLVSQFDLIGVDERLWGEVVAGTFRVPENLLTRVFLYSEPQLIHDSVLHLVRTAAVQSGKVVTIVAGDDAMTRQLAASLRQIPGVSVPNLDELSPDDCLEVDLLLLAPGAHRLKIPFKHWSPNLVAVDLGLDNTNDSLLSFFEGEGCTTRRIETRPELFGQVAQANVNRREGSLWFGRAEVLGEVVVAGGLIGKRGDIVLDSAARPRLVLGVADGTGRLEDELDENQQERVNRLQQLLDLGEGR